LEIKPVGWHLRQYAATNNLEGLLLTKKTKHPVSVAAVQPSRDRDCNCLGSAWVGVQIAQQMPARIKYYVHVW